MKGKISVYVSLHEIFNHETHQAEETLRFSFKVDSHDDWSKEYYKKEGFVFVDAVDVECDTDHISIADVKLGMVEGLRAKQDEIKADAEQACTTIQAKINTLLALTYVEPDQGGEFAKRKRNTDGAEDVNSF